MHPVKRQDFRNSDETTSQSQPEPVIIVEHNLQRIVPWSHCFKGGSPEKSTGPGGAATVYQHVLVVEFGRSDPANSPRIAIDQLEVAIGQNGIGIRVQARYRLTNCA